MPMFDLSLSELHAFLPDVAEPTDFDSFWSETLSAARAVQTETHVLEHRTPIRAVTVSDVTFPGFAGDPVSAWLTMPRNPSRLVPAVIEYLGYGGGRGLPHERLAWASAGYAHLVMDTRGQGSAWGSGGQTPDPHGSGPAAPGSLTKGIESPETYYYRRVFTDAVRAVDAIRSMPMVDADRVAVTGVSQGGGIAIAVGGLVPDLAAVMPDVPFLCHFRRAVAITARDPYQELARYLAVHRHRVQDVFDTLGYFDGVNFARRTHTRSLYSVALSDHICPPSTVFAAFNHSPASEKRIDVYEFNDHEGGGAYQWVNQAEFLQSA